MDKNYYQDEELEEFEEFEDFEDLEQELENDEDGESVWYKERDRSCLLYTSNPMSLRWLKKS